ncbi:hypothetical protein SAMN04487958_114106 [Vreelandella subterranea]|uniref:Uncharacterized protein n=1 Tax=Vreelandella subterranea TaxID=416874 RepID=A0A1H9WGN8_9GAMM|nr:hypothetical protein [Halomonas subterranea]SES32919.1 hypothetical protein SAMN04487958_114106 [Halomonas subterranea]
MEETPAGKKIAKALLLLFMFLQFLSLLRFYVYWNLIGVDPSGYFSIQDVLVLSLGKSLLLFFLLITLCAFGFILYTEDDEHISNKGDWVKGIFWLGIISFVSILASYKVPLEWENVHMLVVLLASNFLRYGVGYLIVPLRLEDVFGSKKNAFIYTNIILLGLFMAFPIAVWDARNDINSTDEKALVYLIDESNKYFLVGKIGEYHVVTPSMKKMIVVPNSRVDKVIYYP